MNTQPLTPEITILDLILTFAEHRENSKPYIFDIVSNLHAKSIT